MSIAALSLVSWDLDGTLYDPDALKTEVRRRLAQAVRPRSWRQARDAGRALRRHRHHEARVRAAGGLLDAEAAAFWSGPLWQSFLEAFVLPALATVGPWPGLTLRLARLQSLGVPQVVVSDFPVEAKLEALGLSSFFARGFAGTELGALKPHPSVMAAVFEAYPVPPAQVLHVGDRPDTDGRAAEGAGVGFAHIVRGDFVPVDVVLARRSVAGH